MPRLFIALPVSDEVRLLAGKLKLPKHASIRSTPLDELHVTLHFLGETEDATFERVKNVLESVRHPSFQLTLAGVGRFPPAASESHGTTDAGNRTSDQLPRVLWIGLRSSDALTTLHTHLGHLLNSIGIRTEDRIYHPHLTVARIQRGIDTTSLTDAAEEFERANSDLQLVLPVNRFILYSVAQGTPKGSRYIAEREYPLET